MNGPIFAKPVAFHTLSIFVIMKVKKISMTNKPQKFEFFSQLCFFKNISHRDKNWAKIDLLFLVP